MATSTSYVTLPMKDEDLEDFSQYFEDVSFPRGKKSISFTYRPNPKSFATRIYRAFRCNDGLFRLRILKNTETISGLIGNIVRYPIHNTEELVMMNMSPKVPHAATPALVVKGGDWVGFHNAKEVYDFLRSSRISKLRGDLKGFDFDDL